VRSSGSHIAAVLIAGAMWGTTGTMAHHAPLGSDQMLIGLSTFGFGGLILMATRPRRTLALLFERRALPMLAVGAAGVVGYASLYYLSLTLIGVAAGDALALASGPVWAGILEMAGGSASSRMDLAGHRLGAGGGNLPPGGLGRLRPGQPADRRSDRRPGSGFRLGPVLLGGVPADRGFKWPGARRAGARGPRAATRAP
jgi:hypothetical protein